MKRSGLYAVIFLGLMGVAVIAAQIQNQQQSVPMGQMGGMDAQAAGRITAQLPAPLKITFGEKSATWTPVALAALPHTTVTVYNDRTKANETYAGVPLIDLLTPLGLAEKPSGKELRLYVAAVGSDDYEVVYSIGEVIPYVHDATVIVADSENGKPLTDNGPFQLVATREKHPARWVRNLVAIRVLAAE